MQTTEQCGTESVCSSLKLAAKLQRACFTLTAFEERRATGRWTSHPDKLCTTTTTDPTPLSPYRLACSCCVTFHSPLCDSQYCPTNSNCRRCGAPVVTLTIAASPIRRSHRHTTHNSKLVATSSSGSFLLCFACIVAQSRCLEAMRSTPSARLR